MAILIAILLALAVVFLRPLRYAALGLGLGGVPYWLGMLWGYDFPIQVMFFAAVLGLVVGIGLEMPGLVPKKE
jgi:hypothetical protein